MHPKSAKIITDRREPISRLALAAALTAGLAAAAPAYANIVYSISQTSTTPIVAGELSPLSDSVIGTITTDGTMGVLQSSNILDYNLSLTDNLRPMYDVDLTPGNSSIVQNSGGLSAGATGLSFDFSMAGAVFLIQGTTYGAYSGYQYFCFQASGGPCANGETIVPNYYAVDGVLASGLTGSTPLNPPAVPEPGTWAMLLTGMGAIGYALRRRARVALSYA